MTDRLHTSRAQVDRILKAKGNVTVETLQRAAALVGRELRLELVQVTSPRERPQTPHRHQVPPQKVPRHDDAHCEGKGVLF